MKKIFALAAALFICAPAYADNILNINPNKKSSSKWWEGAKIAIYAMGSAGLSYYQFKSPDIKSKTHSTRSQDGTTTGKTRYKRMPLHANGVLFTGAAIGIYDAIKNISSKN